MTETTAARCERCHRRMPRHPDQKVGPKCWAKTHPGISPLPKSRPVAVRVAAVRTAEVEVGPDQLALLDLAEVAS